MPKLLQVCILSFALADAAQLRAGTIRYVDSDTNEAGVTFDGNDGSPYTSTDTHFPGTGVGYRHICDALDAMQAGDDLYLRGDAYISDNRYSTSGLSGAEFYLNFANMGNATPQDPTVISSYPGEWAVLELQGNRNVGLGHANQDKNGNYRINNIVIRNLEIDGNAAGTPWGGITLNGDGIVIEYCYIHHVQNSGGGSGQQGGVVLMIPSNSSIRYSWFDDNGGTSDGNNCAHINLISQYSYLHNTCDYHWFTHGVYDADSAEPIWETQKVEIAYNVAGNPNGYADYFVKNKAHAHWTPILIDNSNIVCSGSTITGGDARVDFDPTYRDRGVVIHHNLVEDHTSRALYLDSDFAQVYKNIIRGRVYSGEYGLFHGIASVFWNNTIIGGGIVYTGPSSSYYSVNDYPVWAFIYNNVLSHPVDRYEFNEISIAEQLTMSSNMLGRDIKIDRNYNYNRQTSGFDTTHQIQLHMTGYTTEQYNSTFSVHNYLRSGGAGLFLGGSGADQYITNGAHQTEDGGATIASGGINAPHPYLPGIAMPAYIGATNPDDIGNNNWVYGLLTDIKSTGYLRNASDTPHWIEHPSSGTDTDPPILLDLGPAGAQTCN